MAYGRRRRVYRRRRVGRGMRRRMRRPMRRLRSSRRYTAPYVSLCRSSRTGITVAGPAGFTSYASAHTLGSVTAFAEFTNLFREYKLVGVRITYTPLQTSAENALPPAAAATVPMLYTCYDYNNDTPFAASLTGVSELMQNGTARSHVLDRPRTFYLKPKVMTAVADSTSLLDAMTMRSRWLATDYPGVVHYGFKSIIWAPNCTVNVERVDKFYFKFRGTK